MQDEEQGEVEEEDEEVAEEEEKEGQEEEKCAEKQFYSHIVLIKADSRLLTL